MGSPTTNLALAVSPSLFTPIATPDSSYTTCAGGLHKQEGSHAQASCTNRQAVGLATPPSLFAHAATPGLAEGGTTGQGEAGAAVRSGPNTLRHSKRRQNTGAIYLCQSHLHIWLGQHVGAAIHCRQPRKGLWGRRSNKGNGCLQIRMRRPQRLLPCTQAQAGTALCCAALSSPAAARPALTLPSTEPQLPCCAYCPL